MAAKPRMLLVHDNEELLRQMAKAASQHFEVDPVDNALEADQLFSSRHHDVVILDWQLVPDSARLRQLLVQHSGLQTEVERHDLLRHLQELGPGPMELGHLGTWGQDINVRNAAIGLLQNGVQYATKLLLNNPTVKVIIITGGSFRDLQDKCVSLSSSYPKQFAVHTRQVLSRPDFYHKLRPKLEG